MSDLYKIILVDDEDEVRERISSKISAESGFEVVGTAGNGYDALELIEKYVPHVVLTDIKMPYIDGIELARIIRRDWPTIKIGFITGYDQFDYAREAVQLGACTYLTKPLTQDDISSCLVSLKQDLDTEYTENYNRERIAQRYQQYLPLLVDNWFVSVLASGKAANPDDIAQLRQYGVSLDDSAYIAACIRVERDVEHWGIIEFEKLKLSVRSRLDSTLAQYEFEYHSFAFQTNLVYIIKEKGADFGQETELIFNKMIRTTAHYLSVNIDIGVSLNHSGFPELGSAYGEAEAALSASKFGTDSRVFFFGETVDREARPAIFRDADARNVEHLLRYASEDEILDFLGELKNAAVQDARSSGALNLYALNLAGIVANYAASTGTDINEIAGGDILDILPTLRSFDSLFAWMLAAVRKTREHSLASRSCNARRMLEQAEAYIQTHFDDPKLTMESVCEEMGISISYLSQLFKKHRETTFVKFLTSIRMEKAIDRLKNSGDRIVEIAAQCGYQDVYYFSHSFKKYTGVPPKKYRDETL